MIKTSCISHAPGQSIVMVRQDYLKLCEGATIDVGSKPRKVDAACAAALMNLFEHWTNWKLATLQQSTRENDIAAAGGLGRSQNEEMWIWQTTDDMHEALAGIWGKTKIEDARKWLVQKGYLQQRNNPKFKWDRTFQYFYDLHHVNSRLGSLDSKPAIPKITTEPTIKDKNPTPEALPATDEQATTTPADNIFPMDEHGYWEKSLTHPGMFQEQPLTAISTLPEMEPLTHQEQKALRDWNPDSGPPPLSEERTKRVAKRVMEHMKRIGAEQSEPPPEPEPPTPFATMQAAIVVAWGNTSYWIAGKLTHLFLGTVKDKTGSYKANQLTDNPATVAEVIGFAGWWGSKYEGATMPRRPESLRDNFEFFRGDKDYAYYTTIAQDRIERDIKFDVILDLLISGKAAMPLPKPEPQPEPTQDDEPLMTPEELAEFQTEEARILALFDAKMEDAFGGTKQDG